MKDGFDSHHPLFFVPSFIYKGKRQGAFKKKDFLPLFFCIFYKLK